jgi:hypothetical protein
MSNVHTPERQPGETQVQYRERQARSRAARHLRDAAGHRVYPGNQSSRELQRETKRNNGTLAGVYGLGLLQPQRQRNERRMCALHPLRDDNGAYTLTGFHGSLPEIVGYETSGECIVEMRPVPRRIWLAGVSAQRGY